MISIVNGLRISPTNLDALRSGAIVGSFSKTYLAPDKSFALYPDLQTENLDLVTVDLWAECKSCENIDNTFDLLELSQLTALSIEELKSIFQQRASIFLLVLRVYKLPNPIQVQQQSTGNFVPLPETITISEKIPILDDEQFQEVQDRSKPLDLIISNQSSDSFINDNDFTIKPNLINDPNLKPQDNLVDSNKDGKYQNNDLSWIQTISTLGDRSIEGADKKSTVKAGTDFENIVKRSLEFLGFTIDKAHKGGAGGLDLCCSQPYLLIGECKAGRSIPKGTTEEIMRIGMTRLRTESEFKEATKIIIGSGKPTPDVITFSTKWKVSIIKTMTLQKLVELKAKYDGAINLFQLKEYLQAGQIDDKIDEYIQKVESEIKLRSYIINIIKNFLNNSLFQDIDINIIYGLYAANAPKQLLIEELRDLLIELSSPLAGYLGRVKGDGRKGDRFYYLRDLPIE